MVIANSKHLANNHGTHVKKVLELAARSADMAEEFEGTRALKMFHTYQKIKSNLNKVNKYLVNYA